MERILGRKFLLALVVTVASVAVTITQTAEAQNMSCIVGLAGCAEFYNNTSLVPTEECCGPLAIDLKSELPCLCAAFTNPLLQKQFGIDAQTGLGLLNRCNITGVDPNLCSAPPASQPDKTPVTSPTPPSKAPSGAQWIGFSTFFSILLFIMT